MAGATEKAERWVVRKPAVTSRDGVVATQHQTASEVGARVLAEGGNAVDAAIATSLALAAVEPWMSGLGGGGYMLVRPGGGVRTWAVSFGMVAPAALEPADYPLTGEAGADMFGWPQVEEDRNMRGPLAVAVPGQVAGLGLAHERFGSLAWADLVAPACALAERGMEVDWHATVAIAASAPELAQDPGSAATYFGAASRRPRPGPGTRRACAWDRSRRRCAGLPRPGRPTPTRARSRAPSPPTWRSSAGGSRQPTSRPTRPGWKRCPRRPTATRASGLRRG